MLKILFVCAALDQHGGFENEVEATVRVAIDAGHQVRIYTPYLVREDSTIRRNLPPGVSFDSGQGQWRRSIPGRATLALSQLKSAMRRHHGPQEQTQLARRFVPRSPHFWQVEAQRVVSGCDLLHMFGKPKPFLVDAATCARQLGIKSIYEEVNEVTPEYADREDHRRFASTAHVCDVLIGRSSRHEQDIRRQYHYAGRLDIIEQWAYGAEDALLRIDDSRRSAQPDGFVVGLLGRLGFEKGGDTLLRAFARLRERFGGMQLRIAGSGQAEGWLRRLAAALNLDGTVDFVGYAGDTKVNFYATLDAFVIASLQEGGPITGVEAMAAGLPIVSTPVGAMPERLADGLEALFFEVESVDALSTTLAKLGDSALRRRLGRAARERYMSRNHSRVCVPKKVALWEELGRVLR